MFPDIRMNFSTYRYLLLGVLLGVLLVGCKDDPSPTPAPTASLTATASAQAIACTGEGKINDPRNVAALPTTTGSFCLDPNASDRGYGENASEPLDAVRGLFDGEWSAYEQLGIKRVVEARYVDGKGSGATIDVKLSTFRDSGAAYAMFTRRVVGDGDPAHPDTAKPIAGGGQAALGWGNAFVWRGSHLAEIMYNDVSGASDKAIKAEGDELLPPLSKALGEQLGGPRKLPVSAEALPEEGRLPLGIRYLTEEVAGVSGTGEGAFGYYADDERRWRVMSIVKGDEDQAKDVFASFERVEGAAEEENIGAEAVRLMLRLGGAQTEWIVARKGPRILGLGDEPRVLRAGMNAEEHRRRTLSQDEKRTRLRALLEE